MSNITSKYVKKVVDGLKNLTDQVGAIGNDAQAFAASACLGGAASYAFANDGNAVAFGIAVANGFVGHHFESEGWSNAGAAVGLAAMFAAIVLPLPDAEPAVQQKAPTTIQLDEDCGSARFDNQKLIIPAGCAIAAPSQG